MEESLIGGTKREGRRMARADSCLERGVKWGSNRAVVPSLQAWWHSFVSAVSDPGNVCFVETAVTTECFFKPSLGSCHFQLLPSSALRVLYLEPTEILIIFSDSQIGQKNTEPAC